MRRSVPLVEFMDTRIKTSLDEARSSIKPDEQCLDCPVVDTDNYGIFLNVEALDNSTARLLRCAKRAIQAADTLGGTRSVTCPGPERDEADVFIRCGLVHRQQPS
jgi:hypothetical protein